MLLPEGTPLAFAPLRPRRSRPGPGVASPTAGRNVPAAFRSGATAGRRDLQLDEHALRLATADRVFLRRRVVRARHREQWYRLGLDLWLRRTQGLTERRPVPGLAQREFRASFDTFIRHVASRLQLPCTEASLVGIEQEAAETLQRIRALELVRRLFRRAIELWVVVDAALYLEEQRYCVDLLEFVPHGVTPRNLLLRAHLKGTTRIELS